VQHCAQEGLTGCKGITLMAAFPEHSLYVLGLLCGIFKQGNVHGASPDW
jgi:hypothetical protein